ncbi:MAG: hypothetical protein F6K26_40270 [Moorea sp. SIO2I5]|nr:hypothetical protein [Moorena sp. SIO2I5]
MDIELSRPLTTLDGLDGYMAVQGLLRFHGAPIGYVKALCKNNLNILALGEIMKIYSI